jgi:GTP-binding protein
LSFAPIVFVSAKTQYKVHQIFPLIKQAWDNRQIVLPDDVLKDFMKRMVKKHLPTRGRGVRHPRIVGMTQLGYNPPMFEIQVKANTSVHISYVHFLENQLRREFGFFATPIVMKLTKLKHHTSGQV